MLTLMVIGMVVRLSLRCAKFLGCCALLALYLLGFALLVAVMPVYLLKYDPPRTLAKRFAVLLALAMLGVVLGTAGLVSMATNSWAEFSGGATTSLAALGVIAYALHLVDIYFPAAGVPLKDLPPGMVQQPE